MSNLSPMQEQLLAQASNILQAVSNSVGRATDFAVDVGTKAGNFAAEQLPDIAYQYIAYGRTYETLFELIFLSLFVLGVWLAVFVGFSNRFKIADSYGDWGASRNTAIVAGTLLSVFTLVPLIGNLSNFVMVWVAPKVWLIREIVHLVK